jgi:hypothetical protein
VREGAIVDLRHRLKDRRQKRRQGRNADERQGKRDAQQEGFL